MKRWCLAVLIAGAAHAAAGLAVDDAKFLYQAGQYDQAEVRFQRLSAGSPMAAEPLYYLGKIAVHRGDYAAAIGLLERAVALEPARSDHHLWLGNSYAWAAAAASLGDRPALGRKCLAAYRKALELDPGNIPAHFSLMNFYRHVPALLGGGRDRAEAEAEAIRRCDAAQGAYARAVLCIDGKNYAQAFANLTALLRKNPSDYAANCALGGLALASGTRLDEGETAFRRCLELRPGENDESHGFVRRGLQKIAEARTGLPGPRTALARGEETAAPAR